MNNKKISILLGVLLLAALGYTFYSNQEHSKLQNELEEAKIAIKSDLDSLIVKFDEKIAENTSLSDELSQAKQSIVLYRDSLLAEERTNYSLIRKYKSKVSLLQKKNEELFSQVEELLSQNIALNQEIDEAQVAIEGKEAENNTLKNVNNVLKGQVATAAQLEVDSLGVEAIRRYNSGKLKETTRYKRTDMFKIGFKIEANPLTPKGNKKAYIIVKNPQGKVIGYKGKFTLNGKEIPFSDETTFKYSNKETEVILMTKVDKESNIKGVHTVTVILGGNIVASKSIKLR